MPAQVSEGLRRTFATATTLLTLVACASMSAPAAHAQQAPKPLDRAVEALQAGDYERGLRLLDGLRETANDPRVTYYRGYALEKLGRCNAARQAYKDATKAPGAKKLQAYATDALRGFDQRCTPPVETVEPSAPTQAVEPTTPYTAAPPATSGRVGWRVFGWTSAIVGGLVLTSIPLKTAIENAAFGTTEPYFQKRYGCQVDRDGVGGANCDQAGLEADSTYREYRDGLELAETSTDYMLIGGASLAAVGVVTLITVELTEPGVDLAVTPSGDGARVSAMWRF